MADKRVESEPLDVDEGPDRVIRQQPVGVEVEEGGGEWPDPDAPPQPPAPGSAE